MQGNRRVEQHVQDGSGARPHWLLATAIAMLIPGLGPLTARAVGTGLATQPSAAEVATEVDALIGRLTACGGACAPDRTEVVVKAACSAVVGSASTLLQ